jgi:hypothetical protein
VFDAQGTVPDITQTDEWDEDVHLPSFSSRVTSLGLEAHEAQDRAESTFDRFSRDVLVNSSAAMSDDSDGPQGEHIPVMMSGMRTVSDKEQEERGESQLEVVTLPMIEFKPWSGNWTWPQALEADRREKAEGQAFDLEFGRMKEAGHPVTWERLISNAERSGDLCFKAIESRKPPEDQRVSLEDTYMGSAIVIWNQSNVAALRQVDWASVPMNVSLR